MKQKLHYLFTLVLLLAVSTAWSQEKDFTGGELYTLQEVQYGKFEARMKMAAASGTVSSMFLYQDGSEIADGRPWVEVDVEILGKNPGSFQSNIITGKAGAQVTSEKHHAISPAADQAFHTYAIEWTPTYVRWTVDGVEVRKTEGGQVNDLTGTQGLRFNLWSSESVAWVGSFDESKLPLFQFINWVKVYRYTPGEGPDGSDFTLDWTDNFDTFDSSRWGKGDWTFDGNRVYLTENNVYCKDGMMILALTRKGEESFTGSVPIDAIASGNCGTSGHESEVTWTLASDGVLTISGTGAMADYNAYEKPWDPYSGYITSVVIEGGVTTIGKCAFFDMYNVVSISIPASVTSIGKSAFMNCGRNAATLTLTIADGLELTTIDDCAFYGTKLTSITIPANVTSIGDYAFSDCSNLTTITFNSNPFIGYDAFPAGATVTMNLTANSAGGAYWTTFYNNIYSFQADANTQVFKVTLYVDQLTMHEVANGIVDKNTAVVLKSTGNPVMTLTTSASSNTDDNNLVGVNDPAGKTSDGTMYVLNNGSNGVGFYKLKSGSKLGVGKAYLEYDDPTAPSFFGFGDETTDIENFAKSQEPTANGPYYNLAGQRVAQPTKGLCIVNGKKVVIK